MSKIVKKKDYQVNAEMKTIGDYALIIEHMNGFSPSSSKEYATQAAGEPLFDLLLERNIELFKTGTVVFI